jgi:hypothetical protein
MVDVVKVRRTLLVGMFLLAAGALALHHNVHSPMDPPPGQAFSNAAAFIFVLFDAVVVTFLFSRKKTAAWGYLFNGLIVIYGTVLMTHYGWSHSSGADRSLFRYVFHITTPEVIMAWTDFCLGAVLYRLWHMD